MLAVSQALQAKSEEHKTVVSCQEFDLYSEPNVQSKL